MKPVERGPKPKGLSSYKTAKPWLLKRLGAHCSYCELGGVPTTIDVEHIYPKEAHPSRKHHWGNFLLACTSCNSKKHAHLGKNRQRNLWKNYLWPHLDNTSRAFTYLSDGRVEPAPKLSAAQRELAERTIAMTGFLVNPKNARGYRAIAIAYTGIELRERVWQEALAAKAVYLQNPSVDNAEYFAFTAAKIGYFSIWMEVFRDRTEVRSKLIKHFKADPDCFDNKTETVKKGRV